MDDKEVARKGYGAASEQTVLKILFILFVVAFCVYLVPPSPSTSSIILTIKYTVPTPGGGIRRIYG